MNRYLEAIDDRLRGLRQYVSLARPWYAQHPGVYGLWRLIRWYPRWYRCQWRSMNLLDAAQPWLPFDCEDFLRTQVRPGWKIFEYGSGGSTMFYTLLGAEGVSVEHDADWAARVEEALRKACAKWQVLKVTGEAGGAAGSPEDPSAYASKFPGFENQNFRKYAAAIDAFPEAGFDLVVVDGRARPSCLVHGASRVKPGGFLMLDDSQRDHYQPAMKTLGPEWKRIDFSGPRPLNADLWPRTTIWQLKSAAGRFQHQVKN